MSTTQKPNAETNTNPSWSWQNPVTDSMKDIFGLQIRTAQLVLDKSMTFGQSMTEFCQAQMAESMKLTQEFAKYGWSLTETVKKSAFEATDRTVRSMNS